MSFATRYRNLPINYKLRMVIMATVIAALIIAGTAVLVYDQLAARDSMRNDLGVLADIFSANSTAALSFKDPAAGNELLSTLKAKRHIVTALIYSADGKPFASYYRMHEPIRPIAMGSDGSRFENDRLELVKGIVFGGQVIGTVYLASDLNELGARLKRFTGIILAILVIASLVALVLSSKLQGTISKPIAHLAQVAETVSHRKDYATRAVKWADDDFGRLTDTFNEMLSEIEARDVTLLAHQDQLEDQVAKRTAELARSEARSRSTLEAAPDAIVVVNGDGNIVLVNTQTERTFGHPRDALLGRNMDLLFPERFRSKQGEPSESHFAGALMQTAKPVTEMIALHADGTEFSIEISTSRLETEEGLLVFSVMRDVTERKNAEQRSRQLELMAAQAQAANKAKSMFLSTMSHEIRTPMNAILGYSQLMLRDPNLGSDGKKNLKIINRSGEHLLNIINDVLDMAKIKAGRMQLKLDTFDFRALLQ